MPFVCNMDRIILTAQYHAFIYHVAISCFSVLDFFLYPLPWICFSFLYFVPLSKLSGRALTISKMRNNPTYKRYVFIRMAITGKFKDQNLINLQNVFLIFFQRRLEISKKKGAGPTRYGLISKDMYFRIVQYMVRFCPYRMASTWAFSKQTKNKRSKYNYVEKQYCFSPLPINVQTGP